jgi:hypothetical protein
MREALQATLLLLYAYIIDARLCDGFFFESFIEISDLVTNFN